MDSVVAARKGTLDPDKTMQVLRGMAFESPRGRIATGADLRDIVQTVYGARKTNGTFVNVDRAYPRSTDALDR